MGGLDDIVVPSHSQPELAARIPGECLQGLCRKLCCRQPGPSHEICRAAQQAAPPARHVPPCQARVKLWRAAWGRTHVSCKACSSAQWPTAAPATRAPEPQAPGWRSSRQPGTPSSLSCWSQWLPHWMSSCKMRLQLLLQRRHGRLWRGQVPRCVLAPARRHSRAVPCFCFVRPDAGVALHGCGSKSVPAINPALRINATPVMFQHCSTRCMHVCKHM